MQTHSPTVLVVDDDPNIIRRFQRTFMSETSLGVAACSSLELAYDLICDERFKFDAVISDLAFDSPMQSQQHGLYTGIDFLTLTQKKRPNLDKYIISVFSDDQGYRKHAATENLEIVEWYEKLEVKVSKPWLDIEKHLFLKKLKETKMGQKILSETDNLEGADAMRSIIHESFKPMSRNYLTLLPDPDNKLQIVKPIEVIGRVENGVYFATAMNIGLIQSGVGDNFHEAMTDLQDLIITHYETVQRLSVSDPADYIEKLKETIDCYIRLAH